MSRATTRGCGSGSRTASGPGATSPNSRCAAPRAGSRACRHRSRSSSRSSISGEKSPGRRHWIAVDHDLSIETDGPRPTAAATSRSRSGPGAMSQAAGTLAQPRPASTRRPLARRTAATLLVHRLDLRRRHLPTALRRHGAGLRVDGPAAAAAVPRHLLGLHRGPPIRQRHQGLQLVLARQHRLLLLVPARDGDGDALVRRPASRSSATSRCRRSTMPLAAILASTFVFLVEPGRSRCCWQSRSGQPSIATWLLIPVVIAYLEIVNVVFGVLLASSFTVVRDVANVWTPLVRLLFYVSGAIFPFANIPEGFFRTVAAVNPLSPVFVQIRVWFLEPERADLVGVGRARPSPPSCRLSLLAADRRGRVRRLPGYPDSDCRRPLRPAQRRGAPPASASVTYAGGCRSRGDV